MRILRWLINWIRRLRGQEQKPTQPSRGFVMHGLEDRQHL